MQISSKCPSDKKARDLRKLVAEVRKEKHTAKVGRPIQTVFYFSYLQRFYKNLNAEIEDERQLIQNYQQIMSDLGPLEIEASTSSNQETMNRLQELELKIDLLRKQCNSPRHYVASSIEGSSPDSNSPTRRRRILLKITNSVTTIIKGNSLYIQLVSHPFSVVEDALKRQPKSKSKKAETSETSEVLRQRLSRPTASEDISVVQLEEMAKDQEIEALLESAQELKDIISSMVAAREMPTDDYDQLLQSSMVGLISILITRTQNCNREVMSVVLKLIMSNPIFLSATIKDVAIYYHYPNHITNRCRLQISNPF